MVREYRRLPTRRSTRRELEKERQTQLATSQTKAVEQAKVLARLCGLGDTSSWVFVMEFLSLAPLPERPGSPQNL